MALQDMTSVEQFANLIVFAVSSIGVADSGSCLLGFDGATS